MTDGDVLLRAILANPADDAPRLVFADHLDETGRPEWATLIRRMIETGLTFTILPCVGGYSGWNRLGGWGKRIGMEPKDVRTAFRQLAARDAIAKGADLNAGAWHLTVGRGLVAQVETTATNITCHAYTIFRLFPVQYVGLTNRAPSPTVGGRWMWTSDDVYADQPDYLTYEWYRRLAARPRNKYPTLADARNDLSAALIKWGRELVGLEAP